MGTGGRCTCVARVDMAASGKNEYQNSNFLGPQWGYNGSRDYLRSRTFMRHTIPMPKNRILHPILNLSSFMRRYEVFISSEGGQSDSNCFA